MHDDEDEDEDDDAESERDDEPGAQDEVTRLRRQRSEALDTVRRQRDELAQLRERLRVAEAARAAARTTYNRAEREPPFFMPRGPHPYDVPEDGVHDPAEAYNALYDDPFSDADDEPEDCEECGHAHDPDESCDYARGSSELRDAEREIAALRRDARRNDPQAVAALAAQLRAHQLRYDELEARHRELDARVGDLVRQRNEAHSVYHEAKIKWQEEVRRLQQQLNASGESGEEVIRQLGQEIEAKEHEIFLCVLCFPLSQAGLSSPSRTLTCRPPPQAQGRSRRAQAPRRRGVREGGRGGCASSARVARCAGRGQASDRGCDGACGRGGAAAQARRARQQGGAGQGASPPGPLSLLFSSSS